MTGAGARAQRRRLMAKRGENSGWIWGLPPLCTVSSTDSGDNGQGLGRVECRPMTRSELIAQITARSAALTVRDVEAAVKAIFESMTETLANGERIEIRGFGSFRLTYRPPRIGRNPLTGDTVPVPAKALPHFKAGRELAARVNSDKG